MIVVTGAAGFIGSVVASSLQKQFPHSMVLLVDDFSRADKWPNIAAFDKNLRVERDEFPSWFENNHTEISWVIHLGARTDTTEFDKSIFDKLNLNYSKKIWELCSRFSKPLIYASSAATYGMGEHGYSDDHGVVEKLKPLNPYGASKQDFDCWVLRQSIAPPFWAGLKFFNVFGPNEYHKGRMASVVFHAFHQIRQQGYVKLFKSHRPDFEDGMQLRDFVYVKDVAKVIIFLMQQKPSSGIYNLGTGKAQSFKALATACFKALELPADIRFVDTPEDIRDKYQYFTQAEMQKLRDAGYHEKFMTLEEAVDDYVKNYLAPALFL